MDRCSALVAICFALIFLQTLSCHAAVTGTGDQSCNHHFTALEGTLTSPNYPSNYDNNAACSYIIDLSREGGSIGLQFNDIELEACCDKVYYGEGVTVNSRTLGYFTGSNVPPNQIVTGDQMWFYFQTDRSVTFRGFNISWIWLADPLCDNHFTALNGTLTSPYYPFTYNNNARCSYIIDLSHEGISFIGFQFNDFELENCFDKLHYGEGITVNNNTIGIFNGNSIPTDRVVNGDQMWFQFSSDTNVTRRGFSVSWMGLTDPSCNHHFTALNGTLTSTNYPSDYYNNASCSYIIDLSHEEISSIGFQFNYFNLENRYDFLYYGEGVTVNSNTIGHFTDNIVPPDQVVAGDQMWFYFRSDRSIAYRGFSISWMGLAES